MLVPGLLELTGRWGRVCGHAFVDATSTDSRQQGRGTVELQAHYDLGFPKPSCRQWWKGTVASVVSRDRDGV